MANIINGCNFSNAASTERETEGKRRESTKLRPLSRQWRDDSAF